MIFVLAFYSIIYCIKQIKTSFKKIETDWKIILEDFLIVVLSNSYVAFLWSSSLENTSFIFSLILIFVCEIIPLFMISKKMKPVDETFDLKNEIINYFKRFPFLIIVLLILMSFKTYFNLNINKEYKVIGYDKVIVYSNPDYYLVLNC